MTTQRAVLEDALNATQLAPRTGEVSGLALLDRLRASIRVGAAYVRLDAIDELSYPLTMVLHNLGTFFPVFLQYFVSKLVPPNRPGVGGDYFTYALIGLAVAAMLQRTLSGFGGRLERAQNQGTFETLLVEPVPWVALPFAMNLWPTMFAWGTGFLILGIGLTLDARIEFSGVGKFAGIVLMGTVACSAIGVVASSLMILAKRSGAVLMFYGYAASLLGGALFPLDLLPERIRLLSYVVPHMYVMDAARKVLMTNPPAGQVNVREAMIALGIFNVIMLPIGVWLFSRSVQYARKMGMLSGY